MSVTKIIEAEGGKQIKIYDQAVERTWLGHAYMFAQGSYFKIGYHDSDDHHDQAYQLLYSRYSEDDVDQFGLLHAIKSDELREEIQSMELHQCMINLSMPAQVNFAHIHADKTLLVYLNPRWDEHWAGETQFYNDDISEVIYTSMFKPCRAILFDGGIPHTMRPQSIVAPQYRLTAALAFNRKEF